MKYFTFWTVILINILSLINLNLVLGQTPDLGSAASFTIFTAAGAFTNTGTTTVKGDIGSNNTAFDGDPVTILAPGEAHFIDAQSAQAANDLQTAYADLGGRTNTNNIDVELGGQTLSSGVHFAGGAASLNGILTLSGSDLIIIKINGAFLTATGSQVVFTNGATLNNVYFYTVGRVDLGTESSFQGNILSGGALNLLSGSNLTGRALTTAGAVSLNNNTADNLYTAAPLPVTLISFKALVKPQGIVLNWITASEQDNDRYEVERSVNGKSFSKIGQVKGAGTSSIQNHYVFSDFPAFSKTTYYRLRQIDTDGRQEYSKVIAVNQTGFGIETNGIVYPNPGTGLFKLSGNIKGIKQYRILNVQGQIIQTGDITGADLDLTYLNPGTYLLELSGEDGQRVQRLIRQ